MATFSDSSRLSYLHSVQSFLLHVLDLLLFQRASRHGILASLLRVKGNVLEGEAAYNWTYQNQRVTSRLENPTHSLRLTTEHRRQEELGTLQTWLSSVPSPHCFPNSDAETIPHPRRRNANYSNLPAKNHGDSAMMRITRKSVRISWIVDSIPLFRSVP